MHSPRAALRLTLLTSTILLATACTAQTPSGAASEAAASSASVASDAASEAATSATADVASAASSAASEAASGAAASASTATAAAGAAASNIAPPKGFPPGPTPVEGKDYTVIDTPADITGPKVQVTEVFGFGCPHCNALQPALASWEKTIPSDVEFTYMPAVFGAGMPHCWDDFARAFYAAQAMGVEPKTHDGVYKEVWDNHKMNDCAGIPAIYGDLGVDAKNFASTMQSFAVSAKVASAHELEMRWQITGTPTLVVDGKYAVGELTDTGPAGLFHTVDWLIAKQRPEHAKH